MHDPIPPERVADTQSRERRIGDLSVSPLALGSTTWTFPDQSPTWGSTKASEVDEVGVRAIHTAVDCGITLIDTARAYTHADHPGHSEALIARALATHPQGSEVVVATKAATYRDGDSYPIDAGRETVRRHLDTSLEILGVDRIDLYQLHWPDPRRTMTAAMQPFAEARDEGRVRHVGVSNVSVAQLEEARAVVPIVSVQNRFSLFNQDDRPMVDYCTDKGIAYLAYAPLRGRDVSVGLADAHPAAAALARRKGISIQCLALSWLLHVSHVVIPICGAGRPETVRDCTRALDVALNADELEELSA